jgi:chromate transporter
VTFGGAYAVLAYLQQQAVDAQHWLTAAQMIDGLGLAETTPGPLILVNQYVGFLAGWRAEGGGFWLALACAAMASWTTFAPSYLWIFAGAPYAEALRQNRFAAGALASITAAVLGVIASLALWFALHVLFSRDLPVATPWGHTISVPEFASFDPLAALISFGAAIALIRLKANVLLVIMACAIASLLRLAFVLRCALIANRCAIPCCPRSPTPHTGACSPPRWRPSLERDWRRSPLGFWRTILLAHGRGKFWARRWRSK